MEESFGHYYKGGQKDQMFCLWRKYPMNLQFYRLWGENADKLTMWEDIYKELALEGPAEILST